MSKKISYAKSSNKKHGGENFLTIGIDTKKITSKIKSRKQVFMAWLTRHEAIQAIAGQKNPNTKSSEHYLEAKEDSVEKHKLSFLQIKLKGSL